jgi:hypothetical protein
MVVGRGHFMFPPLLPFGRVRYEQPPSRHHRCQTFGRALIEIMAKYASDLRREIRIEPSVTLQLGIEVGWSPKITIGIEGKGGGQRSVDEG